MLQPVSLTPSALTMSADSTAIGVGTYGRASRARTRWSVDGRHKPPRAVGTPSVETGRNLTQRGSASTFASYAIGDRAADAWRRTKPDASSPLLGGATFVRSEMRRRSNCAKVASM